jgi:Helix-turn-helix domain
VPHAIRGRRLNRRDQLRRDGEIILAREMGEPPGQVAARHGVSERTVRVVLQRWKKGGPGAAGPEEVGRDPFVEGIVNALLRERLAAFREDDDHIAEQVHRAGRAYEKAHPEPTDDGDEMSEVDRGRADKIRADRADEMFNLMRRRAELTGDHVRSLSTILGPIGLDSHRGASPEEISQINSGIRAALAGHDVPPAAVEAAVGAVMGWAADNTRSSELAAFFLGEPWTNP